MGDPESFQDEDDEGPISAPPSTVSPRAFRIEPLVTSSTPPPASHATALALTDLLLAAAHCDGALCKREHYAIEKLMAQFLESESAPPWIRSRIERFDPARFNLERTAQALAILPAEQRRYVLELARRVCDTDNAYDLEEERFIMALTLALRLGGDKAADLMVVPAASIHGAPKRAFDILFSLTFLLLAWPLLLVLALLIKVTSPGPALFIQTRYGADGKDIQVWKFRTMTVTEQGSAVRQATRNDPRITRLGAFLRRTSLDELPQFVNVLLGDMSVVGPRPHAPAHNDYYRTQILEYTLRHKVKPGITGLAQVRGWRGETDTLDKMVNRVASDLEYIRSQSLLLDIKIIWLTVFGSSARSNAY